MSGLTAAIEVDVEPVGFSFPEAVVYFTIAGRRFVADLSTPIHNRLADVTLHVNE